MLPPHFSNRHLHRLARLMRARQRTMRPVGQPPDPIAQITTDPPLNGRAMHTGLSRNLTDLSARQHCPDRVQALLHHRQDNQCQPGLPHPRRPTETPGYRVPNTAPDAHHLSHERCTSTDGGHGRSSSRREKFLYGFKGGGSAAANHSSRRTRSLRAALRAVLVHSPGIRSQACRSPGRHEKKTARPTGTPCRSGQLSPQASGLLLYAAESPGRPAAVKTASGVAPR